MFLFLSAYKLSCTWPREITTIVLRAAYVNYNAETCPCLHLSFWKMKNILSPPFRAPCLTKSSFLPFLSNEMYIIYELEGVFPWRFRCWCTWDVFIRSVSHRSCVMISNVPGTSPHIPRMPELYTGVTIQTQQLGINPRSNSKRYVDLFNVKRNSSELHWMLWIWTWVGFGFWMFDVLQTNAIACCSFCDRLAQYLVDFT